MHKILRSNLKPVRKEVYRAEVPEERSRIALKERRRGRPKRGGIIPVFLLLMISVSPAQADYMIGPYYCYEQPYHHCVYYTRPTDVTEMRHKWMPFFDHENPRYRCPN